jgi:glycine/D-amino acid oxidase-like deaminating enzyme
VRYADLSLWHATVGEDLVPRPALPGDTEVDVAIVGAGYTGLWTAYYLAGARPDLRIAVLEAEIAGFGASGRNGGWCSALFPASVEVLARMSGSRDAAIAQHRAMQATVDEVVAVAATEGIEADVVKGGTVVLARTGPQLARARAEVEHEAAWGLTGTTLLDADEARRRLAATDVLGATYTPDCATIHPARLARGLARVVEGRGVRLHERTRAHSITPHRVVTDHGIVSADIVLRCTEGYTPSLAGLRREVAPVYSLIIATEPLPEATWREIGLAERETFADHRNLIVYGQRTADGRMVFGGRGAPYHFGSSISPAHDRDPATFAKLRTSLVELFPVLRGARIEYEWGGNLAVPRDWCASVVLDAGTGLGHAGGYVGDGVATTNLAGRTLRDLVLGERSDLTRLPWVGHRSPRWEPEPLRWLGVNAGLRLMSVADAEERLTGRGSRIAAALAPLLGGH